MTWLIWSSVRFTGSVMPIARAPTCMATSGLSSIVAWSLWLGSNRSAQEVGVVVTTSELYIRPVTPESIGIM